MRLHLTLIAMTLATCMAPCYGQLYLMTGSPTPIQNETFASALFQAGDDGTPRSRQDLVAKKDGTVWISISYDWRKAVLLPRSSPEARLIIVDFDSPAVTKECQLPAVPEGHWLAELPGRGPSFVWYNSETIGNEIVQGMALDSSIPCEDSFVKLQPSDLRYLVAHGRTGVVDVGSLDGMIVDIDQSGRVFGAVGGTRFSFDYQIPEAVRGGLSRPLGRILINNAQIMVLGVFEKGGNHRVLVFRKSAKTWYRLPVPSERVLDSAGSTPTPWLTGFGRFIAMVEARMKTDRVPESAGRAEWRNQPGQMGPSMLDRFQYEEAVFPGRLHLFDTETERQYTIATNQADSEILLVEGNTVYYRASDRLYSAPITSTGIGAARLLATSDTIRDAHWAFMRH